MKRIFALCVALAVGACTDAGDNAAAPGDFAATFAVEARGEGAQKVVLPPAALVAIQRTDLGDVRVFDHAGRPLATALAREPVQALAEVRVTAIPLAPRPGEVGQAGVSVSIAQDERTVTVDTDRATQPGDAGVLFDTRAVRDPVQAIALDADLPSQRPIALTVSSSQDLKTWQPIAEPVLLRPAQGAAPLGGGRIELPAISLRDRYLRVGWNEAERVTVRGAILYTTPRPLPTRIVVPASGAVLSDDHHLEFSLPPGRTPATVHVAMTGRDGVVPIRLLARDAADQPWTLLAAGILKQDGRGADLALGGRPHRDFSIEADPRSAGFSAAPRLAFALDPVVVVASFNGNAPYRLAVGNASAQPAFLNASDLTGGNGAAPEARVAGGNGEVRIALENPGDRAGITRRSLSLWAALFIGVVLLALAAYRLSRANRAA